MMLDLGRKALAEAMDERRKQLGIKWNEVARRAQGMDPSNLRRIRNGDISLTSDAAYWIEKALEWPRGHIDNLLATYAPEAEPDPDPVERAWHALRKSYEAERLDKGPDHAWMVLRQGVSKINELVEQRRQRHAERERREAG